MDYGNYFGRMNAPFVLSSNPNTPATPNSGTSVSTPSASMERNKVTSQSHPDFSTNFSSTSTYYNSKQNTPTNDAYGSFYGSTTNSASFRRIFFQESTTPTTSPAADPYASLNQVVTKEEILKRVQSEEFIKHMNYKRPGLDDEDAHTKTPEWETLKDQHYRQKYQTQSSNFY